MNRGLWAGVWLVAAGCQGPPTAPAESIPPPSRASGAWVTVEDYHPGWEKQPFAGPVTLYRPGKVYPSPWHQLAKETEAVVAALPEKPERVDVYVTSFRLVVREEAALRSADPSENVRFGSKSVADLNSRKNGVAYEKLRSATAAGDAKTATEIGTGLVFQNGDPTLGVTAPRPPEDNDPAPGSLDEHPPGASCRVRATMRVVLPGGREQTADVQVLAAGQNDTGTKYQGEALESAVRAVVRQYGSQVRRSVGLPPDG